ncbi:hypothetical protein OSB04_028848 [Centaurea solstitialis]|uniref:Reverse transcriptase domain-containing protein n=1 Tax=Centaurea solstitialis TaxID=347529 RepID=A0AA38W111_9ASTR|nr:hypothetical protein OSB04_028848 [Centaurea solstitialis]
MVGIDPNVISHKLNVDPTFKPIKQKRRKFAPERNKVINDEVVTTDKIRLSEETSQGHLDKSRKVVKKCTLSLARKDLSIDLIPIKIGSFDIIVGMDWMSNHRATICCAEKIVMLALPEGGVLEVHGEKPKRDVKIVSYMKMRSHLRKECVAFMAHVLDKETKEKQIQDIPIVREFPEVFPEELPGLPPQRQVEFHIDLVPGAAPIAKSPYRLAPSEMLELSKQLQER